MTALRPLLHTLLAVILVLAMGCERLSCTKPTSPPDTEDTVTTESTTETERTEQSDDRSSARDQMVTTQIEARDIDDQRVLDAMRAVPRHRYVPKQFRDAAHRDGPLPIGHDQTISQPYIVALMSTLLDVSESHRILEIGTGSGYQAAVLAELGAHVYTIEIICDLAEQASADLAATGYDDVEVTCGDGYKGWPEHAPFDRIIVTAAPPELPEALVEQLAVGGRLIVPVGSQQEQQMLQVVTKSDDGTVDIADEIPVRFVPMVPGD